MNRAGIRPFEQARSVFAALPDVPEEVKVKIEGGVNETSKVKVKTEGPDILELCNMIPLEVVGLGNCRVICDVKTVESDTQDWGRVKNN